MAKDSASYRCPGAILHNFQTELMREARPEVRRVTSAKVTASGAKRTFNRNSGRYCASRPLLGEDFARANPINRYPINSPMLP